MTRLEALQEAEAYVAQTLPATPPMNDRGYPINGWVQPSPDQRLAMVLKVAAFLLEEDR